MAGLLFKLKYSNSPYLTMSATRVSDLTPATDIDSDDLLYGVVDGNSNSIPMNILTDYINSIAGAPARIMWENIVDAGETLPTQLSNNASAPTEITVSDLDEYSLVSIHLSSAMAQNISDPVPSVVVPTNVLGTSNEDAWAIIHPNVSNADDEASNIRIWTNADRTRIFMVAEVVGDEAVYLRSINGLSNAGLRGETGETGRGITSAIIDGEDLVITFTDSTTTRLSDVIGQDGRGIQSIVGISGTRNVTVNFTDGTSQNIANFLGADGRDGVDGGGGLGRFMLWAEETSPLSPTGGASGDGHQWSFGNGEERGQEAIVAPFDMTLVSLGFNKTNSVADFPNNSALIAVEVNGTVVATIAVVDSAQNVYLPLSSTFRTNISAGDTIQFVTTGANWDTNARGGQIVAGFESHEDPRTWEADISGSVNLPIAVPAQGNSPSTVEVPLTVDNYELFTVGVSGSATGNVSNHIIINPGLLGTSFETSYAGETTTQLNIWTNSDRDRLIFSRRTPGTTYLHQIAGLPSALSIAGTDGAPGADGDSVPAAERVPPGGTAGQRLTVGSDGTTREWQTPTGGGSVPVFNFITVNEIQPASYPSAGTSSNMSFTTSTAQVSSNITFSGASRIRLATGKLYHVQYIPSYDRQVAAGGLIITLTSGDVGGSLDNGTIGDNTSITTTLDPNLGVIQKVIDLREATTMKEVRLQIAANASASAEDSRYPATYMTITEY